MVMRFLKGSYALLATIVLMISFASCNNNPITINPLATLNIELQKKSTSNGITNKNAVSEFDAIVSVAYENDTVGYKCLFMSTDSIPDLYMYDYAHSDVVYAALGKPFRLLIDATIGGNAFHGESEIYVIDGEALTVSMELTSTFGYIDLGLPSGLLWANCNLGANSPEAYGSYYAWGETADKRTYNWNTYIYYKDSTIIKYTDYDRLSSLEANDDAATVRLGDNWRTPTKAEFDELLDNCSITLTTSNGTSGYLFTGSNGNSIFLPMAGGRDGEGLLSSEACGYYWLSSLYTDETDFAWGFILNSDSLYTTSYYRMYGQTIRPVYDRR